MKLTLTERFLICVASFAIGTYLDCAYKATNEIEYRLIVEPDTDLES